MKCYKTVTIVFRIIGGARVLKWEVNNASLFRYLNPPMISEVHKNNMCAYFYIIYCCRRLLS